MSFNPEQEVYYCGKCDRQQQPSEGIKCKQCGKQTVSWNTDDKNGLVEAKRKWKQING